MMFAENDSSNADDLFADTPDDAESSGKSMQAHKCPACGKEFHSEEEIRFCNACGAPLHAAGVVGTVSVVLGEDSLISMRKITAILKRLGCSVAEAANGREAVGLAHQIKPHLIILDVHMPDLNGLEALDALRALPQFDKTTIVMLTGEFDGSVVRDALTRGANDYIRKDSTPTELQERINRHVQNIRAQV
jgi:CheY-like chemotaxis protein